MKRNAIALVTILAAVVFAAGPFDKFTLASEGNGSRALEGTWRVRLSPRSGQPQFDEFMTFTSGGGIVESNNYPFFTLGLTAGPGHGTWEHAGAHNFRFAFQKFLFALSGQPAGTLKAAGVLTYSPETGTWSGPANVFISTTSARTASRSTPPTVRPHACPPSDLRARRVAQMAGTSAKRV